MRVPNVRFQTLNLLGAEARTGIPGSWRFDLLLSWAAWASIFLAVAAPAQPAPPAQEDPLISLMMAQPKIDVDGPVNPRAAFDPPVVSTGEQVIYRITFNALEESIQLPDQLVAPKELSLKTSAHGQILQMTGPSLVPLSAFNYRLSVSATGTFTIPEFVAQVYGKPVTVPAARLEVSSGAAARSSVPRIYLEFSETNLFVGQPARARVIFPASVGGLQGLGQVQLNGKGFIVDQGAAHQQIGNVPHAGTVVPAYVYETLLTPLQVGKLSVFAQGFTTGNRFSGPIIISGGMIPGGPPQYALLESDPVEITARPLPREGELPGFTGAIGDLSVDPPILATNAVRAGEPVKMAVRVHGDGNLGRIAPPPAPRVSDWQVLAATSDEAPPQIVQSRGFVEFNYTLVPLSEKTTATPAIPFSCFQPQRGEYKDLTIPPVPITILPGSAPSDFQALAESSDKSADLEDEPSLGGLAPAPGQVSSSLVPLQESPWFPFAHVAPASAFLGLWVWDRRRKFLEQHPDILVRRRARRALHREWRALREAARRGDASQFATGAVRAMQVACAPHYPADPRALVGRDVVEVLYQTDQSVRTAEVVRSFFDITDASCFATTAADAASLLTLQPELDQVLGQLESRL